MSNCFSSHIEDCAFSPLYDGNDLIHDTAIRRFCVAARSNQEDLDGSEWDDILLDVNTWPSWDFNSSPCWGVTEEEIGFVDSFINTNTCEEVNMDGIVMQHPNNHTDATESDEGGSFVDDTGMPIEMAYSANVGMGAIDKGLELVHLLLACAEAVGCRDTRLGATTLSQIWSLVDPSGDSLQRVSFCFAQGLRSRLSHLNNVGVNGSMSTCVSADGPLVSREERMEGFRLLYQTTPYIAFAFMAANEAICEAAAGKDWLHIIDLGMEHALQWPSLIRALASRTEGPPKLLRITGVIGSHADLTELMTSMKVVVDEANLHGLHVEFQALVEEPCMASVLSAEKLGLRQGEAVFVNCIMHMHRYVKESRGSLKAVLTAVQKLGPVLMTVVEQDANHDGPFFLARFLESLHYYSAVFDSLEASLPRTSAQRMKIELCHFADEIHNIVAYEGSERVERHERADQWRRQLGRAGFQVVALRSMSQARMLLSLYGCDGYTLGNERGCLLLGWKGRPLMWVSAWQPQHASSPSRSTYGAVASY